MYNVCTLKAGLQVTQPLCHVNYKGVFYIHVTGNFEGHTK